MNIQSLESTSVPFAIVGNQATTWGARSVQALSSNPLLAIVSVIAIALGAFVYVINRMKASDQRAEESNKKLAALPDYSTIIKELQDKINAFSNTPEKKQTVSTDVQDKLDLIEAKEQISTLNGRIVELDRKITESTNSNESLKAKIETTSKELITVTDSQSRILSLYKKVEQALGDLKKSFEQKQSEMSIEQKAAFDQCTAQIGSFRTQFENELKLKISSQDFEGYKKTQLDAKKSQTGIEAAMKKGIDHLKEALENLEGRYNLHIDDFSRKNQSTKDEIASLKDSTEEKIQATLKKVKEFSENLEIHVKALLEQVESRRKISSDNRKKEIANLKAKVDHLFVNRNSKDSSQQVTVEKKDESKANVERKNENLNASGRQDKVEKKDDSLSDSEIGKAKNSPTRPRGASLPETPKNKLPPIQEVVTPGSTPFKPINGSLRKLPESVRKLRNTLGNENPIALPEGFNPVFS